MRIGLLTEGEHPYASGESRLWCDRLVRGLSQHEFDLYALDRGTGREDTDRVPPRVRRVRTAPPWTAPDGARAGRTPGPRRHGRRDRHRFTGHFERLATALCRTGPAGDAAFADGLHGPAEHAVERGGPGGALRSETAARVLEAVCRAPGAHRSARGATVPDHLALTDRLERLLLPLSLDRYGADALGAADLCHAASGGAAALPGLLAKRFFGTPLPVTEYGVRLRAHYPAAGGTALGTPARSLLAAFHRRPAAEVYRQAAVVTPGTAHARPRKERCGADRDRLRTVYPGTEAERFASVGEGSDPGDPRTLARVGGVGPVRDRRAAVHRSPRAPRPPCSSCAPRTATASSAIWSAAAPAGPGRPRPSRSRHSPSRWRRPPGAPGCSPYGPGACSRAAGAWATSPPGPGPCSSPSPPCTRRPSPGCSP